MTSLLLAILAQMPAQAPVPVDANGDPLPAAAVMRLGTARLRHAGPVKAVAFSADGRLLASAGEDCIVRVWDAASGRAIVSGRDSQDVIHGVAFSPDAAFVATVGGDQVLRLYAIATGKRTFRNRGHGDMIRAVAFAPDGKTVATAGNDQTVKIWKTGERELVGKPRKHPHNVTSLAYSPDGTKLAAGAADGDVAVWDVAAEDEAGWFKGHTAAVTGVAYSPDGKSVVTSSVDGTVRVWQVAGRSDRVLHRSGTAVAAVAWSRDGTLIAAAIGKRAVVWSAADSVEVVRTAEHPGAVHAVALSPDGRMLATGGADHLVRLFDAKTGRETTMPTGDTVALTGAWWSPDGAAIATAADDGSIRLWSATDGKLRAHLTKVGAGPAFTADGKSLVVPAEDSVRWIDVVNGAEQSRRPAEGLHRVFIGRDLAVQIARNGTITGGRAPGEAAFSRPGGGAIALSPSGATIAVAGPRGAVQLRDTSTGKDTAELTRHNGEVSGVVFTPDGRAVITCGQDGTVRMWNAADGVERLKLRGHEHFVHAVAVSPDGLLAATGGFDRAVIVWDLIAGKEMASFEADGPVRAVAFSPDGGRVVSAGDECFATVWRIPGADDGTAAVDEAAMEKAWADAAGDDLPKALRGVRLLRRGGPAAAKLLRARLEGPADAARIEELVAKLDDGRFKVRQAAQAELQAMGPPAEAVLVRSLGNTKSTEAKARIEALLEKIAAGRNDSVQREERRARRMIAVLGAIGGPDALAALERLTRIGGGEVIRADAQAVLERMKP